jgi:hypothetical protein
LKVTLNFREERTEEVDIEFPVYRKHDLMPDDYQCVIYTRIESLGQNLFRHTSITIREEDWRDKDKIEIEIEAETKFGFTTGSDKDYSIGQGNYALTAEEFAAAWERARKLLEAVK